MKKLVKKTVTVEMKTAEYVEYYNKTHIDKIDRRKVYAMIQAKSLKARKGKYGAWFIKVKKEVEEYVTTEYTVKEYTEAYNKLHRKNQITEKKVRELIKKGKIEAVKKSGKYIITDCPRRGRL